MYLLYIILIFKKYIFIYLWIQQKVGVLEISHILKVDEKITYIVHPTDTKV